MRLSFFAALCLIAACAHQVAPKDPRYAGFEQSVFVVSVIEDRAGLERRDESNWRGKSLLTVDRHDPLKSQACNAVYVAPHLLVTSASSFERRRYRDNIKLDDIRVIDGDGSRGVREVLVRERETGLVLLRTEEEGIPIKSSSASLAPGNRLTYVGHEMSINGSSGVIMTAGWNIGSADYDSSFRPHEDFPDYRMLKMRENAEMCGAAILDDQKRLIGIVTRVDPDKLWVLPIDYILAKARNATAP
jgi:hypothetical protein